MRGSLPECPQHGAHQGVESVPGAGEEVAVDAQGGEHALLAGLQHRFLCRGAQGGVSTGRTPPAPPAAPPAPRAPPDEAMVTRMRASPRVLCSSEYWSFSVTEARMSCTEAERRLRMVTYEWSGMYTRQKTGERAGGQRRAPPHHPRHSPSGKLRHGAGPEQTRRGDGPVERLVGHGGDPQSPSAPPHSHSLSSEPRNATRVCKQESMRRKCRNRGFTCLFGGGVSSATLWGHRTGLRQGLGPPGMHPKTCRVPRQPPPRVSLVTGWAQRGHRGTLRVGTGGGWAQKGGHEGAVGRGPRLHTARA